MAESEGPPKKGFLGYLGFPEPTAQQRKEALEAAGPTWREYFFRSFLKVWIGLALFIVDIWIIVTWIQPLNLALMLATLAVAIYLEFLLYQYLWRRASLSDDPQKFRPSVFRPVLYGRWTIEADLARAGKLAVEPRKGPDPKEFL